MQRSPARNDELVRDLQRALSQADFGLRGVPNMLVVVLRDGSWRERTIRETGEVVTFTRFAEFVTAPPLRGLGATVKQLERLCADDPEARDLLDAAVQVAPGRPSKTDNNVIQSSKRPGNMAGGAVRRLRKDRPDLHARVLAGELSPHAAAVLAGFRRATMTVPREPQACGAYLRVRYSAADFALLMAALADGDP